LERQAAESSHPGFKSVLEKRDRTDVAEDRDLLTRPEKELLQDWEERMMRLTAAAARVDEAVFVLRDLDVFSHS
jgi:DNA-directed RNA polymerase III subunit RPC3